MRAATFCRDTNSIRVSDVCRVIPDAKIPGSTTVTVKRRFSRCRSSMSRLSPQMLRAAFEALYPAEKCMPCQRPMLDTSTIRVVDDKARSGVASPDNVAGDGRNAGSFRAIAVCLHRRRDIDAACRATKPVGQFDRRVEIDLDGLAQLRQGQHGFAVMLDRGGQNGNGYGVRRDLRFLQRGGERPGIERSATNRVARACAGSWAWSASRDSRLRTIPMTSAPPSRQPA